MSFVALENYLLATHVFILASQIKTVKFSALNRSEIFTFLLHVKIVCRQNMLSGKCSFCITGRPKKLVRMIKLFFGCFVSVWRNLLGLELKVTSNWMYEAVLCAASSYHGVIISYHI